MQYYQFLNPKNAVAFKKIFGTAKNKDILIHFLNDMLVFREQQPITAVSFLQTVPDIDLAVKRMSLIDILCRDAAGNAYVVAMLPAQAKGFEKRAQYYAAHAYLAPRDQGDPRYAKLQEVIFLAIVDFIMLPAVTSYKSAQVNLNKDSLKDFSFTVLELAKFTKDKDHLVSMSDKWAYYFKHVATSSAKELQQICGNDVIMQQAYEELNSFNWHEDERIAYESSLKIASNNQEALQEQLAQVEASGKAAGKPKINIMQQAYEELNSLNWHEDELRAYESSVKLDSDNQEALEEQLAQVEASGKAAGRTEGKAEINIAIAKLMLQEGATLEFSAKVTQIPLEQLMTLENL